MSGPGGGIAPELGSVLDFLRQTLPFSELEIATCERAAAGMTIAYHRRGEQLGAAVEPAGLRILRAGAVDLRAADNKLLDRLGEGESFHIGRLNSGACEEVVATFIEDSLVYLLPDPVYQRLRASDRHFDRFYHSQRDRRLRRAARYEPQPHPLAETVGAVMSTDPLGVAAQTSVREAATAMTGRRVSSALVLDQQRLLGIVTDRDLRQRVLVAGLAPATPVAEIMTPQPHTIDADASLFEALLAMTRHGCHHLPVLRDGVLCGMLTNSDLMLARRDDPVYLVQHLSRQESVAGLRELLAGVPQLVAHWVDTGVRPRQVSRVLTAISDAVTVRLLQLAEAELGPAPVPYCWLGFGSQGRCEQLLGADQDNGLVIADSMSPGDDAYFARLADFVCDGLNACGYPYCGGEVMASNTLWRQPLAAWQSTARGWTHTPTPDAVMRVTIFFDLRAVHGDASLCEALQETMLRAASQNTIFLAALAANALDNPAPLGIFRRFVVDRDGSQERSLDLKKRGVLPLTDIIRLHALAAGLCAVNSEERLRQLVREGHLATVDGRNLSDALHCLQRLRLQHQVQQIPGGEPTGNRVDPRQLPKMAREQLRDAFAIVHDAQVSLRLRFRQGLD